MCSAPNVYMFVYILIGTYMVPLMHSEYAAILTEATKTQTDYCRIPDSYLAPILIYMQHILVFVIHTRYTTV